MKAMKVISTLVALLFGSQVPAYSQSNSATVRLDSLPNSGTYFIVNSDTHEALQPGQPSLGQNVFLYEFNKGGTQKWTINRIIDPKTKRPTNRYTIRLAGENKDLKFQPHPSVGSAMPILGLDTAVFALEASADGVLIKSVSKNGDAMFVSPQNGTASEPHFAHNDGSAKFRWNFINTAGSAVPTQNTGIPLPNTGTYFIVNASSHEALQPGAPSLGQTVFLYEFNSGGTQKWMVTRKIDPATKKPTNRYSIRLAGENQDLNFQPHPSIGDAAAIIGTDKATYVLEPSGEGFLLKSVSKNGDALFIAPQQGYNTEPRFGPNDGSSKFQWNFVRVQ
jgi:hypothetical protein